ncbi:TetR/AcrR family transcriptional regulator [Pseudoruegeria sp. SHC-113]|uniref:TetR/AcrR family transcriptional regulator n=1 Tax=Pseudoruegeria sp. SHC-113 TaxID=2855439 RepID=UPI0021BA8442|nr:TetR/AcrR family transcriptional regulator [Pseudoruegeria sp. SHC-113]
MLEVTQALLETRGFSGLRIEEIVEEAGVAKGTLFAHFTDKDGLLAVLIGAEMMRLLDAMEAEGTPDSVDALLARLAPQLRYIGSEREIFDLLLRYSGTIGSNVNEGVARSFERRVGILAGWIAQMQAEGVLRRDQSPECLAEGLEAFINHVLALGFCSIETRLEDPQDALRPLLTAWLLPQA